MQKRNLGLISAIIGVLIMSIESPFIKLSTFTSSNASFFLGICIFISSNFILLSKGKNFFIKSYINDYKGVVLTGLFMGIGNYFFVSAVIFAGVANTVLILASSPIFSSFFTYYIFKTKIKKSIFISIFFIFVGLFLILKNDFEVASIKGIFYAFISMFCMCFIFVSLRYYKKASKIAYVSVGGLCMSVISSFSLSMQTWHHGFWFIIFLGIFTIPFSRYLVAISSRQIYPHELSLLMLLESALAPILAWWWLDESLGICKIFGGFIIFFTLIIYVLSSAKRHKNI